MYGFIDFIKGLGSIVLLWGFFILATGGFKGPKICREAFAESYEITYKSLVEFDSFFTRVMDDHWVTALLFQPKDMQSSEIFVVCHFESRNLAFDNLVILNGDRREQFKNVSDSRFNPITLFD